jgi:pimeloyl-ACP methyl ester carboxylesterase
MEFRLNYREQGAGEPLVLLHGNGESLVYFNKQMGPLSARYRVIAVDTRGHGGSARGNAPFTLDQFAEDLLDFFHALGLKRASLLGFSDGANIALLFALRYPDRVHKLILNGANLFPGGVKPSIQIPICTAYALTSVFSPFSQFAKAKKELFRLMVREPQIAFSALTSLKMPVLVVAGNRDMIKDSHTRAIARAIPGAKLCILEGDHFVAQKNSAAFNAHVLLFLGEGETE